jgi:protein-tyrosine phosphatase
MLAGMYKVLMVCMGNICRSPLAHAVMQHKVQAQGLADKLWIDSAGTHGQYHAGEAPDPRAQAVALRRGYTQISQQRARSVEMADFETFDLIVAMDHQNHAHLKKMCPDSYRAKLSLFLEYAPELAMDEMPDPYYGDLAGFEKTLELCEAGVQGMLAAISSKLR